MSAAVRKLTRAGGFRLAPIYPCQVRLSQVRAGRAGELRDCTWNVLFTGPDTEEIRGNLNSIVYVLSQAERRRPSIHYTHSTARRTSKNSPTTFDASRFARSTRSGRRSSLSKRSWEDRSRPCTGGERVHGAITRASTSPTSIVNGSVVF